MFTTDSRTERFLDSVGVKWTYTNDMTFDRLRGDWNTVNLGRSQAVIDSAVDLYGTLMDRGSPAPGPLLYRNASDDLHDVIDGVQRLVAERKRKPKSFSAYVIATDSIAMVNKLRIFANYRLQGGHQESAEWTLGQAISYLTSNGDATLEDIAEIGGWPLSVVRDKKQCMDCGFAIRSIGGPDKLPDSILRIVSKHAEQNDYHAARAPLADFLNDVKTMKMSADEAGPYIEQFFCVARTKCDVFKQFKTNLEEFRRDSDIACRLEDPARRRYQPMTAEGRLLKSLKATLTTAERVRDGKEKIAFVEEYFQVLSRIHKTLKQIESFGRKK